MNSDFFSYSGAEGARPRRRALDSLSDEDWKQVIAFAARRRYARGAAIVTARETERAIFVVVDGTVRIEGARRPPGGRTELSAGDAFGVETFLAASARGASATAATPVEVLMLNEEGFSQLAAWKPRVAILLLRDLAADVASRLGQYETPL